MTDRIAVSGVLVRVLAIAVVLAPAACAELGDAWSQAGRDVEALFDTSPRGPNEAEQQQATASYKRALQARASGDSSAAAAHFREAAELGHSHAAYELGLAYLEGRGVPTDLDLSATWINRAADLGDPGAEFLVGSSLYAGIGIEQDVSRGLSFLERAAEQGHAKAQFLLGQAYVDGIGVEESAKWAARWYGKAANGGHVEAQYALGVMFASGLGVPENPSRAYQWLNIAVVNGYRNAARLRDQLAKGLAPPALAAADAKTARFSPSPSVGYEDSPTVMYVQLRLRELGFDAGPVDGIAGPRTRAAIEAFQSAERMKVDGKLTRRLVDYLFELDSSRGA